jgi:hypothetical protein
MNMCYNSSFSFLIFSALEFLDGESSRWKTASYTEDNTNRINPYRNPCLERYSNPRPSIRAGKDSSCFKPCGHCDRQRIRVWSKNSRGFVVRREDSINISFAFLSMASGCSSGEQRYEVSVAVWDEMWRDLTPRFDPYPAFNTYFTEWAPV